MAVWAIADLHLAISIPDKNMDIFGPKWFKYMDRIKEHWEDSIGDDDLVLLAGDITWAKYLEDALIDLGWIDNLPGTKVMIKGNHDYWWGSIKKVKEILPPSIHLIQNDSFTFNDIAIAGTRLWDSDKIDYTPYFNKKIRDELLNYKESEEHAQKIFNREVGRLETSLKAMDPKAKKRICMLHYPPITPTKENTVVTELLEKYKVDICIFGHLHNLGVDFPEIGVKNGIAYYLVACDHLNCHPLKILD
jgi:uncharacterized protein